MDVWELPPGSVYQGIGRRGTALFIDAVLFYILLLVLQAMLGDLGAIEALLFASIAFNYLVLCEWRWGQTLGKRLLLIRVYSERGTKAAYNAAALRNVGLLIDFLPLFFLVGLICMSETSKHQRLGDRWGHTVVVGPGGPALGNPPGGYRLPGFAASPPPK